MGNRPSAAYKWQEVNWVDDPSLVSGQPLKNPKKDVLKVWFVCFDLHRHNHTFMLKSN